MVPIYFCLFTVGGVLGAAMAYQELCWPWVLLFVPGLGLCMGGVFAITNRRQRRLEAMQIANSALCAAQLPPSDRSDGNPADPDDPRASAMSHASIASTPSEAMLALGGGSLSSTANLLSLTKQPGLPISESLLPPSAPATPAR